MTTYAVTPHRTVPNLRRVLAGLEAAEREIATIRASAERAHANAVAALNGPGSGLGGSGRSSGISDPTGRQALAEDPAAQFLARLAKRADNLPRELRPLADESVGWALHNHPSIDRKPTSGAGACLACGRWVHGTADDRLRSGMCEAHYRAWCRAGRPERGAFFASVPMWDEDAETDGGEAA
jgi:hypothetical protein